MFCVSPSKGVVPWCRTAFFFFSLVSIGSHSEPLSPLTVGCLCRTAVLEESQQDMAALQQTLHEQKEHFNKVRGTHGFVRYAPAMTLQ